MNCSLCSLFFARTIENFRVRKKNPDGLDYRCRKCLKAKEERLRRQRGINAPVYPRRTKKPKPVKVKAAKARYRGYIPTSDEILQLLNGVLGR